MENNNELKTNAPDGALFKACKTADTAMTWIEKVIMVGCSIVMVVIILADIVARNILNNSIFWAQELARYMMIMSIYFGASFCVREKAHLGIDVVISHLKGKIKVVFDIIIAIFSIGGFIILAILQFKLAHNAISVNQTTPTLYIQYGYLYTLVGIAMIFCAIRSLMVLIDDRLFKRALFVK